MVIKKDMIELSPYLSGIQKVKGSNLSEKFNTLNKIAKKIVESKSTDQDDSIQSAIDSSELPDTLKPLVQVEIARLLRQPEGIVEALKSDDSIVFARALKVKWFFNGSIETHSTIEYYQTNIWPFVSLKSRFYIIKALADNLTEQPAIAEQFYTCLCEMYGEKQAHSLLKACSESFIWDRIIEDKVRLDKRLLKFFLYKYPELIVKYLKLSKESDDPFERNVKRVDLYTLTDFLPRLVKKCPDAFVELIEMHNNSFIDELSNTRTELFLKNCSDALMKNAKLFLPILDLKTVTKILNEEQFKIVFTQLFPQDLESFKFDELLKFLKFIPEEKKLNLMTSTFEEVYKINLLDCTEKITSTGLKLLPRDDRIKQAKLKLEIEKETYNEFWFTHDSWICYLSPEEAIKHIKLLIMKTSAPDKRSQLLQQLIYTCIVNSDNNAMLEILKYITTRHKNEGRYILLAIFDILLKEEYSENLEQEHWDVVYDFFQFLHVKNYLCSQTSVSLLTHLIRFDLINNHPITDKISMLADILMAQSKHSWNILKHNNVYEKQCLEEFFKVLSTKKPDDENYPNGPVIKGIVESIYSFNKRNQESKSPIEPMSIKDYPWIFDNLTRILDKAVENAYSVLLIRRILREEDKDLYKELVKDVLEEGDLQMCGYQKTLQTFKSNPKLIMDNWQYYLKECISLAYNGWIHELVKLFRWQQDLPVKFVEEIVWNIKFKNEKHYIILALLMEGSAFEQILTPFIPTLATINISDKKRNTIINFCLLWALRLVNPPVSLEVIEKFCINDHIHTIVDCLVNVTRRTSVDKVISFAMTLIKRPVSIKKHGIRLLCMVADVKQLRSTLINLWRSETHQTIRKVVFSKILKVFHSKPNKETWEMIIECIDDLKPDDQDSFDDLFKFQPVPNEYIADYIEKLFSVFRKLGDVENGLKADIMWSYIIQLLNVRNHISALFSEEQHEKIIDKYILDLSLPKKILTAGHDYLINSYIIPARDKLEERLKRFREIFVKIVKDSWDIPQSNDPSFYPANYFVHNLNCDSIYNLSHNSLKEQVISVSLELFNSELKPYHDSETFLYLTLFSITKDKITPQEFASKVAEILPSWITIFSSEFISEIATYLYAFINTYPTDTLRLKNLDVIEALIALNVDEAIILAAHLLLLNDNTPILNEQFSQIFNILKDHQHPTVNSIAYVVMHKIC